MKKIIKLIGLFFCSVIIMGTVQAKGIIKVDSDLKEKGEVESSRVLIGNNVTSEENVDGISIIAANTANINGSAPYAVYVGNIVTISSKIEKDLFIAASNANISSEAEISRDIFAFVSNMKINATGARSIRFTGGTLDIRGITIRGNVYADANEILMDKDTVIEGKITCFDYTIIKGKGEATVGGINIKESSQIEKVSIWDRIVAQLKSAISLFIVLVVIVSLIPKFKAKMDKEPLEVGGCLSTIAKGLFVLIAVPIVAFFALLTGLLAPLSLIVIALYAILCYIATGLSAYIITNKIMGKFTKEINPYICLLIGIVVIKLLDLIPYAGSFISIVFLLYGIGFVYKLVKSKIKA